MTTDKHAHYLDLLAHKARYIEPVSRCRVMSMIVFKNEIIAFGQNRMKTHPIQARFGRTDEHVFLHSEIDVLIRASKELEHEELAKSTLYVCRIFHNRSCAIAKPCPGCQKAIKSYGVSNVVWSTPNGYSSTGQEELNETNEFYEQRKKLYKDTLKAKSKYLYPAGFRYIPCNS